MRWSSAGRSALDLCLSAIACQRAVKIYRRRPRFANALSRFVACFFHLLRAADTALKSAEGLMDFNKLKCEAPACQNSNIRLVSFGAGAGSCEETGFTVTRQAPPDLRSKCCDSQPFGHDCTYLQRIINDTIHSSFLGPEQGIVGQTMRRLPHLSARDPGEASDAPRAAFRGFFLFCFE